MTTAQLSANTCVPQLAHAMGHKKEVQKRLKRSAGLFQTTEQLFPKSREQGNIKVTCVRRLQKDRFIKLLLTSERQTSSCSL